MSLGPSIVLLKLLSRTAGLSWSWFTNMDFLIKRSRINLSLETFQKPHVFDIASEIVTVKMPATWNKSFEKTLSLLLLDTSVCTCRCNQKRHRSNRIRFRKRELQTGTSPKIMIATTSSIYSQFY